MTAFLPFLQRESKEDFATERGYFCLFPALGWRILSKGEVSRNVEGGLTVGSDG